MASFDIAHKYTQINEGGYASEAHANSIGDRGGETYRGMARNFSSNEPVWQLIDQYKNTYGIPKLNSYINNNTINSMVDQYYKKNFWDVMKLDNIKSQSIANILFDIGTNSGTGTAVKSVQRVLDIDDDGVVGPVTIDKINSTNENFLIKQLIEYRKWWLNKYQEGESYLNALLDRVDRYKKFIVPGVAIALPLLLIAGGIYLYSKIYSKK